MAVLEDAYQVYLKEKDSSVDERSDVENTEEFSMTIVLQNEEWKVSTIPYDIVHNIQCINTVCLKCLCVVWCCVVLYAVCRVVWCVWCVWCVVPNSVYA